MLIKKNVVKLDKEQILNYFLKNKTFFGHKKIDDPGFEDYISKIAERAIHFVAIHNQEIIGLLACYFNHPQKVFGFITTLSVSQNYRGKGLAKELITICIEYAIKNNYRCIRLEVNKTNFAAIKLYERFSFSVVEERETSHIMEKKIEFNG